MKNQHPRLYEINTRVWLNQLSKKHLKKIGFANIPDEYWIELRDFGFQYVWLMGIWKLSRSGIKKALIHPDLRKEYSKVNSDWEDKDIAGSPYAISDYSPNPDLGSWDDLKLVREQMKKFGLKLILDFVPNHTATDHHWVDDHPEYYIQMEDDGSELGFWSEKPDQYSSKNPSARLRSASPLHKGGTFIAHGRDPFFQPWTDTAQLNYFNSETRTVMIDTLKNISKYCDGVRCDMAMLVTNEVFDKTWCNETKSCVTKENIPNLEFWTEAIQQVKKQNSEFIFMAEVYWDMEYQMIRQGFDYCYDKRLYDRMLENNVAEIKSHLSANNDYQRKLIRFIENHDEPRAVTDFGKERSFAAAVLITTLPGLKLFYQGQLEGFVNKVPVQMGYVDPEATDIITKHFYRHLLQITNARIYYHGEWHMLDVHGIDQESSQVIAYLWKYTDKRRIVVVNFSGQSSKAHVDVHQYIPNKKTVLFDDQMLKFNYQYKHEDLSKFGLYVELEPYKFHIFEVK